MSRKQEQLIVIGGGITGRLVQVVMPHATVFDWGPPPDRTPTLTRAFGTNYLWEPLDGIPCRSFSILTEVDGKKPTDVAIRAYKQKIGKGWEQTWGTQFEHTQTGYEIETLPDARIDYNMRAVKINPDARHVIWSDGRLTPYDVLFSTIPMYALIELLKEHEVGAYLKGLTAGRFKFDPIYVKVTSRPPDAKARTVGMYVNYNSDPDVPVYRTCDRDGNRHYESLVAGMSVGIVPTKKILPGKIHVIDPTILSEVHARLRDVGIVCFGRFATWNPEELVHTTYRDIRGFKWAEGL